MLSGQRCYSAAEGKQRAFSRKCQVPNHQRTHALPAQHAAFSIKQGFAPVADSMGPEGVARH